MDYKYVETLNPENIIEPRIGDAGHDLVATTGPIFDEKYKFVEYGTNVRIAPSEDNLHGFIFPRSSISKTHLFLANSVGVIDSSYRGEIRFRFRTVLPFDDPNLIVYQKGDKIGQIVFFECLYPKLIQVSHFQETERGYGGFGSTGK